MNECVYMLANDMVPGVVKIGRTKKSPYARASELSRPTGVAGYWDVIAYILVRDSFKSELEVHASLSEFWIGKEFFACSWDVAYDALRKFGELVESSADDGNFPA